jgi:Ni/Fe-hydrogenase 1 B-type cytochrome subunit
MQTSQPARNVAASKGGKPGEIPAYDEIDANPRKNVYVWELPVRLTHWVTAASIVILTVTGLYIAHPFINTTGPASNQYLMGVVRFIHFVAAFVFTASVLLRVYWLFVGNQYGHWDQWLPVRAVRRRGIRRMMAYYAFIRRKAPAMLGHNPLAGTAYTILFTLFVLQILTGFALYSLPFDGGFWPTMFGWVNVLLGIPVVRVLHEIIMWLMLAFVVHHVYTAILIDNEEKSGLMSSIFTGYKSLTRSQLEEVHEEEAPDPHDQSLWTRLRRKQVSMGNGKAEIGEKHA